MRRPRVPKKVREWSKIQTDPAFALACWMMMTPWFKEQMARYVVEYQKKVINETLS